MSTLAELNVYQHTLNRNAKLIAVETNLQQTMVAFKDLVQEFHQLYSENMEYRRRDLNKGREDSETLKKELEHKNDVIQQIASALTKLLDTKDFKIVDEMFKIIFGDLKSCNSPTKKSLEYDLVRDESLSEIEGTPGRKSPIIGMGKILKNSSNLSLNRKKCADTGGTPEKKNLKLVFPSPSRSKGRMKQSRLSIIKLKSTSVVDLTCSPEMVKNIDSTDDIKCNIKKEILDNDETILPSPTSGPLNLPQKFKSLSRESPSKFKKPQTPIKFKIEEETCDNLKDNNSPTYTQHTADLMKHCKKSLKMNIKVENQNENEDKGNESMSLLQQNRKSPRSPQKPLAENNNITNIQDDIESSLSILQGNKRISPTALQDKAKRTKLETVEPIYKEPTVRKKVEKRNLRGWSCQKCEQFYGTLYADNLEMLALKMDECSKHRGRNNPVRPSTPTGFWEPRWDVPTDTEEFNRRNNAI